MAFRVEDFVPAPPFRALEGFLREVARRGVVVEEPDEGGGLLRGPTGTLRFLGKWIARPAAQDAAVGARGSAGRARAWTEFAHPHTVETPAAHTLTPPEAPAGTNAADRPVCVEGDGWAMPDAPELVAQVSIEAARARLVEVYQASPGALAGGISVRPRAAPVRAGRGGP